jgi:hypothetical protein
VARLDRARDGAGSIKGVHKARSYIAPHREPDIQE